MRLERIYLIRHGQTDWNREGRWQGFEQTSLNSEGLAQAQALAEYLRQYPITAVYTSDLSRALQTANALAQALNLQPELDERWRERHLGIFQGLTRAEINARYPKEMDAMHTDRFNYVIPNGESQRQVQERAWEAWQQVINHAPGPEAAIVSHGGTLKTLLMKLSNNDPDIASADITNTSVTTVELSGGGWSIAEVAVTPHLVMVKPDVTEEGSA
jgi:broad specificity phosphatase PhoE